MKRVRSQRPTRATPSSFSKLALLAVILVVLVDTASSFVSNNNQPHTHMVAPNDARPFRRSPRLTMVQEKQERRHLRDLPKEAFHIYTDYASRLWNETNPEARQKIARAKTTNAIKQVQHILQNRIQQQQRDADDNHVVEKMVEDEEEDDDYDPILVQELLDACDNVLTNHHSKTQEILHKSQDAARTDVTKVMADTAHDGEETSITSLSPASAGSDEIQESFDNTSKTPVQSIRSIVTTKILRRTPKPKKKNRRSILFGATMGGIVACWVFSGNYIFTGLFTLMTILGQLEYYRMVMGTGVYPARRISVVGACSMFWTALFCPNHHQIVLPLAGLYAMIWFLTMKRSVTTISEIATTFTGMFYLGYVPSFWVRIRLLDFGGLAAKTRLAPIVGPFLKLLHIKAENNLPGALLNAVHLPITTGAVFIFWTWLCLAFNDVFAYFVGKFKGRIKLGSLAPAIGATSPNKTLEGVLGGCAASVFLAMLGK